ncbi:MAG: phage major tail tube protein [Eubacteriales bacterium]|nr:phage major tail tube protein [Eubacteriales bacterium]
MSSPLLFPEVVNNFNVYSNGDKFEGVSGEVTLPTISAMTATVSGAGVLGEYNAAVVGMTQSITQEIPFRIINKEYFGLIAMGKQTDITLRSSIQNVDRSSGGAVSTSGMRLVFRGRPTAHNMGQLRQGDLMNASVTLELTYILIEMDGATLLELDKLNSVYTVNGEDLLKNIRNQC